MKNNKGFTLIELAVSFCLTATISIMLLQLVLSLKDVYISGDVKTTLLNKQGIMVKKIYDDLNKKQLESITSCGLSCLTLTYDDSTSANLLVDPGNRTLTYNDYTMQLDNSSNFGILDFSYEETDDSQSIIDDSILTIDIPISSKLLDEDFGIHIVKTYNHNSVSINDRVDINNAIVTLSGVNTIMASASDDGSLVGVFIRLFHQQQGKYIADYEKFLKNSASETLSTLTSLEALRTKNKIDKIITAQEGIIQNSTMDSKDSTMDSKEKTKQITMMKETFQNGYFSLLLDYNNDTHFIDLNNPYTWWYQTSNFTKKEALAGVILTSDDSYNSYLIPYQYGGNACKFSGLKYNSDQSSWVDGCDATHYAIGLKSGDIISPTGNANNVNLWAEAKEYVCKYSLSDVTINGVSIKSQICKEG